MMAWAIPIFMGLGGGITVLLFMISGTLDKILGTLQQIEANQS